MAAQPTKLRRRRGSAGKALAPPPAPTAPPPPPRRRNATKARVAADADHAVDAHVGDTPEAADDGDADAAPTHDGEASGAKERSGTERSQGRERRGGGKRRKVFSEELGLEHLVSLAAEAAEASVESGETRLRRHKEAEAWRKRQRAQKLERQRSRRGNDAGRTVSSSSSPLGGDIDDGESKRGSGKRTGAAATDTHGTGMKGSERRAVVAPPLPLTKAAIRAQLLEKRRQKVRARREARRSAAAAAAAAAAASHSSSSPSDGPSARAEIGGYRGVPPSERAGEVGGRPAGGMAVTTTTAMDGRRKGAGKKKRVSFAA